jgi:hypothetical protein
VGGSRTDAGAGRDGIAAGGGDSTGRSDAGERVGQQAGEWLPQFQCARDGAGAARGLLYHHLFSSQQPDFRSENREIERAIGETEAGLQGYAGVKMWVVDCGFDNDHVWWRVWSYPGSYLVVRLYHYEQIVLWQNPKGVWEERYLDATFAHLRLLAEVETEMEVRLVGQKRPKRQMVTVRLSSVQLRVYHPTDRQQTQAV